MPRESGSGDSLRWTVALSPAARRALTDRLPADVAAAAWELIIGPLVHRPTIVGAPLKAPYAGLWRARRGEYRIRYRLNHETGTLTVLEITHRRDVYRS